MATKSNKLGKAQGWGIVALNDQNRYDLIEAFESREKMRYAKRNNYASAEFRVAKLDVTMLAYGK